MLRWVLGLLMIATTTGCESRNGYVAEVDAWHAGRVERLQTEDGWFSLAGLFWLSQGENSIGSDEANHLVFPDSTAPSYLGTFYLDGDTVRARFPADSGVEVDGEQFVEGFLAADVSGAPTVMRWGDFSWYVIERDGSMGIRLKDRTRAARSGFSGIERYPVDVSWRVPGTFARYDPPRTVVVPTVMNTPSYMTAAGAVEFEIEGTTYRLEAMGEPEDEQYWIIFGDRTNRDETYPAGRYVYIRAPDADGNVVIDFNRAYNPPCAFSTYATCPYPPPQNRLPFRVESGELRYPPDA